MQQALLTVRSHGSQAGFSLGLFCLGLAAFGLALFQLAAQLGSQNLAAWAKTDNGQARSLLEKETPKAFLALPAILDAQVDVTRHGGSLQAMQQAQLARLSRAPANAHYWSRYAVDLQRYGETGPELEQAVNRALQLAPHSKAVALEQSIIAAYNWQHVSPTLQKIWLGAFKTALQRPKELAWLAINNHVADRMCELLPQAHALENWCTRLPAYRKACQSDQLTDTQQQWCRSVGL